MVLPILALSGKVMDGDGAGIRDATLFFTDVLNAERVYTTRTDADGNYLMDLPVGIMRPSLFSGGLPDTRGMIFNDGKQHTRLQFIAAGSTAGRVMVYDLTGKCIRTLKFKNPVPGIHTVSWDLKSSNGQPVPPGMYIYTVTAGRKTRPLLKTNAGLAEGEYHVYITGRGMLPFAQQAVSLDPAGTKDFVVRKTDLWDSNRVVLRSLYNNSRFQFLQGTGRVAFMGGSITNMRGWRDTVQNYLSRTFPQTQFDFIEAGIPSLGSKYHAFRYTRDIIHRGKVDLLILESAVNDVSSRNETNDSTRLRSHEGILRQARLDNPEMI
jgi:hypothetical protein